MEQLIFCSACGAAAVGRFCGKCGSPLVAPAVAAPNAGAVPAPPRAEPLASSFRGEHVVGGLSYCLPTPLQLPLFLVGPFRRSRIVQFHLLQGAFTWLALIVLDYTLKEFDNAWKTYESPVRFLHTLAFCLMASLVVITLFKRRVVLPITGQIAEMMVSARSPATAPKRISLAFTAFVLAATVGLSLYFIATIPPAPPPAQVAIKWIQAIAAGDIKRAQSLGTAALQGSMQEFLLTQLAAEWRLEHGRLESIELGTTEQTGSTATAYFTLTFSRGELLWKMPMVNENGQWHVQPPR